MDWNKTSYFIVIASILPFKKDCNFSFLQF